MKRILFCLGLGALLATLAAAQTVTITQPGGEASSGDLTVLLAGPGNECGLLPELCVGADEYAWVFVEGAGGQAYSVILTSSSGIESDTVTGSGTALFNLPAGDVFQAVTVTAISRKPATPSAAGQRRTAR